jgi:L-lactate utilization protein LutB
MSEGTIRVTVQREDRLHAINELCSAVRTLANALNQTPNVTIHGCNITTAGNGPALSIDTEDNVTRTEVLDNNEIE